MKQQLEAIRAHGFGRDGYLPRQRFAVLLSLVRKSQTREELRAAFGLGSDECRRLLDSLHREYLVDVVSHLEGRRVKETLRLTEEGELVLLRALEGMCELPEALPRAIR